MSGKSLVSDLTNSPNLLGCRGGVSHLGVTWGKEGR